MLLGKYFDEHQVDFPLKNVLNREIIIFYIITNEWSIN